MRWFVGIALLLSLLICAIDGLAQTATPQLPDSPAAPEAAPLADALVPPKLISYVEAAYPPEALQEGLEAAVTAELDIDETGRVVGVTITEPAGYGFDAAAETAMFQFVFEPATKNGAPIPSKVIYRYTFFLKEDVSAAEPLPPPVATLRGTVTDVSGTTIPKAAIVLSPLEPASTGEGQLAPTPRSGASESNGAFGFEALPPVTYQVDVIAAGYKPFSATESLVDGETREVIYRLEPEAVLYETVVRGRRPPREVTRREITRREITRIPGTGGDALRSIQNLPGMARAPGLSGALIVRGSSPTDSRYFFDQLPVPLLYHFGGLTSVINSDLLEQIDFFPGNYGVRYGGATGGIVEVYPRAPKTDRLHAYLDVDFADVSALLETPISDCWSIAISARRSYIDGVLNAVLPEDDGLAFTVAPRYYDYQLVANYHPHPKDELQLFFFGSDDKLVFIFGEDVADNPNFSGGIDFSLYFHQGQARWVHKFSKDISNTLNLGVGVQSSESNFADLFVFNAKNFPGYLRNELVYDPGDSFVLRTGIDAELSWAKWQVRAPLEVPEEGETLDPITEDERIVETTGKGWFYRAGWYGEVEIKPIPDLRFIAGLRGDYYSQVDKFGLDPRFVTRYQVMDGTVLKAGVGLFHQRPQDYQSDEAFGNPDLNLITAIHYSAGIEQQLIPNVELGLEGFYKDMSSLVVGSQEMVSRNGELVPERYNNDGKGHVYGLEVLLKHYPTDRFFGWISYTLMKSSRIDHLGEDARLFDFDQTHILTVVASAVLGRGWEAGLRFRLVTGNPETPVMGAFYDSDADIYFPVYGEINSDRLPTFHQLDLRIDKNWQWKYLKLAVYIDVQNIYNQKNPEGYQYNFDFTERRFFTGLPVLPILGIKLEY
ncbi:MAG: TonB-dependent receptor [Myxococcota bacterium]|nr:TonB-dependent receptor [Myxococcota bacterium]